MLSVAHTLASLPFGVYLQNPIWIFCSAFILHLLLDTLTHWNVFPTDFKKFPFHIVAIDIFGGLFLAWLITGDLFFSWPILLAIAAGNAPDVIQQLWEMAPPSFHQKMRFASPFFIFHDHLQLETRNISKGLVSQVIASVTGVILFLIH